MALARYRDCHEAVLRWAARGRPPADEPGWDALVEQFLEMLYAHGEGAATARYVLFGVIFILGYPRSEATFPRSRRALQGFKRLSPEGMRDPPPAAALWLLAEVLASTANSEDALLTAVLLLLAYDCYLRPSEGLALRRVDVTRPRSAAGVRDWSIVIAPPDGAPAKNKQFDCGVMPGFNGRRWAVALLQALYETCGPDGRLFRGLTLARAEAAVRAARRTLDLGVSVDLHGARHCGPSHDAYFFKTELAVIQARGRWVLLESCRRYNKPAKLSRQLSKLDAGLLRRARILEGRLPVVLGTRLRRTAPPGRKRKLRVLG